MDMADTVEEDTAPECKVKASSIKAIDKKSVHRICSGQVVLTLATAVKELVENSIDAGASSVEVKLKDYGSESIEVVDNGSGVKEENFEGLALKHHTSKLTDFDDLVNVETFGFRGEALSSLCALSNMIITTRHESTSVGTRLEFNMSGKVINKKPIPKPVGTIVVLENIFHTLPVRHKEFQRNLKKEFARLVQVLNAYCIINTGVRISCINVTSKGNRTTVISTNGNISMRDNISNIFGSKQIQSLLEFKQIRPKEAVCLEYGVKMPQNSIDFSITGYISKCEHGQGRSSTDRQFIFINKRPCDATKILKLINEVYHLYNRHQYPLISFSIEMQKESVDVNVTPDKRQMFLDGEKLILAVLKTSLIELFEPTSSVYKMNNTNLTSNNTLTNLDHHLKTDFDTKQTSLSSSLSSPLPTSCAEDKSSLCDSLNKLKRNFSSTFDKSIDSPLSPDMLNNNKKSKSSSLSTFSSPRILCDESVDKGSILKFFSPISVKKSSISEKINLKNGSEVLKQGIQISVPSCEKYENDIEVLKVENVTNKYELSQYSTTPVPTFEEDKIVTIESSKIFSSSNNDGFLKCFESDQNQKDSGIEVGVDRSQKMNVAEDVSIVKICTEAHDDQVLSSSLLDDQEVETETSVSEADQNENQVCKRSRKEVLVNFSVDNLRSRMKSKMKDNDSLTAASFSRAFRAKISPGDQKEAEDELQREISKDMFCKMEILGQFNLGFIIARLGGDLFIIDQHATDEKYNFEMLQRNHVLQSQKMIIPQNLELTSSNETILIDNLEIFKKNGFDFLIEPEAPPTQRVKLVSAPVSKNWSFGKDDIEELLFMLMDSPNVMCRPSRVRMMFASRACRKSIMIGTALNQNEMKRLVSHMGEIEQPWNCPHGRPTMRHLFNLNMLPS